MPKPRVRDVSRNLTCCRLSNILDSLAHPNPRVGFALRRLAVGASWLRAPVSYLHSIGVREEESFRKFSFHEAEEPRERRSRWPRQRCRGEASRSGVDATGAVRGAAPHLGAVAELPRGERNPFQRTSVTETGGNWRCGTSRTRADRAQRTRGSAGLAAPRVFLLC